jgi:glycosyltransferase involved in cell wall biosynthesis
MITIVTANKNGGIYIDQLIESLNRQSSRNFNWLIVDSNSTDNSISKIEKNVNFPFKIISQQDFSIYHALNIAIDNIETDYYCVSGCDDYFEFDFVEKFEKIILKEHYDLIFGCVISNDVVISPKVRFPFLSPVNASHSIGTIIKTSLHKNFGNYSKMYPILADKLFVIDVLKKSNNVMYTTEIFGTYSQTGFSSLNSIDYLCDLFKLQVKNQNNIFIQSALFIIRIIKLSLRSDK